MAGKVLPTPKPVRRNPDLPTLEDEPPAVPAQAQAAWDTWVEPSKLSEASRIGLRYWLNGYSWREVGQILGLKDETCGNLRAFCNRADLHSVMERTPRLISQSKRIALKAGAEVERRLDENPEEFAAKELSVIRGIELDKIATHEGWKSRGAQEGPSYLGALSELADKLHAGESIDLSLKVSKRGGDPLPDAIDVTPEIDSDTHSGE